MKCSDIIQPYSDIPESEVTVKIGRQTVRGILKFCGTINEVRVHEKKACESLAGKREPFKDKTNHRVQRDETAGARRPPNKRRRSIENVEQLTTTDSNKKRRKEKETGRILLIAPHNDNIEETQEDHGDNIEETQEDHEDEHTMHDNHSAVQLGEQCSVEEECPSVHPEEYSSIQTDEMSLSDSSSEWDMIHIQVMLNSLQSEVATLKAAQTELVECNKSLLSRVKELEATVQAGQDIAAYAWNTHCTTPITTHSNTLCTTPITTHSQAPNMPTLESNEIQLASTPIHTPQPSQTLASIDSVVTKYPTYNTPTNISRLAVKLAKEAVFGKDVLAQSTPLGFRNLKPLDPTGLATIKATIKNLCVWSNAVEFESIWKNCMHAIGQACKHARKH